MRIASYSEILMRLNPELYYRLDQVDSLKFSFTGTGLNFLRGLKLHGMDTSLISVLPKNRLGQVALRQIKYLEVGSENVLIEGNHLGIYLLELGFSKRPSQVTYLNRENSAFNVKLLSEKEIESSLNGIDYIHLCGIALSTSEMSFTNVMNIVNRAIEKKIKIIFDFNFRASLNEDFSLQRLMDAYATILKHSNVVFGSKRDFERILHKVDDEDIIEFLKLNDIEYFAGTEKKDKTIKGFIFDQTKVYRTQTLEVEALDRIGAGDAFASALFSKLILNETIESAADYAVVLAQMAYTTIGDLPLLDDEFIESYISDPKDVIR